MNNRINTINNSIILHEDSDLNDCILYDTAVLYYRCLGGTRVKNSPFNLNENFGFGLTVMYCAGSYNVQILINQNMNIFGRVYKGANDWLNWKLLYRD